MIDNTFDLFVELGATDEQCEFPVVYASGVNGIAGDDVEDMAETLEPLFEAILREVNTSHQFEQAIRAHTFHLQHFGLTFRAL